MKIGILFFSGTGNTASLVKVIKSTLEANGNTVEARKLESGWFTNADEFDYFIFASPKHYEYIPLFFIKWINTNVNKLKSNVHGAVFLTGGADMATGYTKLIKILEKKNIYVNSTKTIKMASNYTLVSNKDFNEVKASESCKEGEKIARDFAISISNNKGNLEKASYLMECLCKNVSFAFGKRVHRSSKHFSISDECINCKICENACPTQNIALTKNKKKFGEKCIMCTRCLNICPKNAILYKGNRVKQYRVNIKEIEKYI